MRESAGIGHRSSHGVVKASGNAPAEASWSPAGRVSPWTLVFLFGLTLLAQRSMLDRWFNFMDEGHMLQFADMAANGHQFYRDMTFYPLPGAFWFLALVFKVFEPTVILTRWLVAVQFSLFVTLLYVWLRRVVAWHAALAGVFMLMLYRIWAFPHWQIYSYSTTCLLMIVVCTLLLLRFFETGERTRLGQAGFAFGLAVLAKQDYSAAFMLAAIFMLFVWNGTAPADRRLGTGSLLAWFFGPAALVGLATGLYFFAHGILPDMLRFTVFNHFTGMSSYDYQAFPAFFPLVHDAVDASPDAWLAWLQDPRLRTRIAIAGYMPGIMFTADWSMIRSHPLFLNTPIYDLGIKLYFYLPPTMILAAFISLFRRRVDLARPLGDSRRRAYLAEMAIAVVGAGLLLLAWINKPQDYLHLAVLYWPLLLLVVIASVRAFACHRRVAALLATVLVMPAFVGVAYSVRLHQRLIETHDAWVDVDRAGIYVQPYEAVMLEDLVDYVDSETRPGDRVAAIPYFPILNFLADRLGPHRSAYIVWPVAEIDDRDEQVVEAMEETETDIIIWHFTQFDSFPPVWEYAPTLFEYLVDHFVIDRVFSYDVWRYKLAGLRREDPGNEARRGVLVVRPDQSNVSLVVEGPGPPVPVAPSERADFFDRTAWPFRRVLSVRPTAHGDRTVLRVQHAVAPEGEILSSGVAVHPQWWFKLPPSWIDFEVHVEVAGERVLVYERRLNPSNDLADRRWFEFEIDLSAWAGKTVDLLFVNAAERARGEELWMAGWWEPRVRAAGNEAADAAGLDAAVQPPATVPWIASETRGRIGRP